MKLCSSRLCWLPHIHSDSSIRLSAPDNVDPQSVLEGWMNKLANRFHFEKYLFFRCSFGVAYTSWPSWIVMPARTKKNKLKENLFPKNEKFWTLAIILSGHYECDAVCHPKIANNHLSWAIARFVTKRKGAYNIVMFWSEGKLEKKCWN